MRAFTTTELKNGVRVVLVPHEDTMAATALVLYGVGSRYERGRENGAAHFIEHLMFKGTGRRPSTLAISRDLDGVGADYNAFTGKDYTGYYIRLPSERLPMAVDMLHDMIRGSLFRAKDIEAERQVILEEIRMYEDNPMELVDEMLDGEMYRGSPLARPIGGTVRSVSGIRRGDLLAFRRAHYRPERAVIAVAGRFDGKEALAMLQASFGRDGRSAGRPAGFRKFRAAAHAPRVAVRRRETEQVQVAMGFRAYPYAHPRLPALSVLSTVLGGSMSSRLFMSVREREGLCYSIRTSVSPFADTGDLTVHAGLSKDRLDRALALIMKELRRIKDRDITAEELARAKEFQRGRLLLALEDSSRAADWYARQALLIGRIDTPQERLRKVFAVTKADVRRAAAEVLSPRRMAVSAVGPLDGNGRFANAAEALS